MTKLQQLHHLLNVVDMVWCTIPSQAVPAQAVCMYCEVQIIDKSD